MAKLGVIKEEALVETGATFKTTEGLEIDLNLDLARYM
jgi:hypothetical protein